MQSAEDSLVDTDKASTGSERLALRVAYAAIILLLLTIGSSVLNLRIGSLSAPGSGQWPALLVVLGLALAGILFFTDTTPVESGTRSQYMRVMIAVAALFAFIPLYYYLGFPIAAAALGYVYLNVLGNERWWVSLLGATANAIAIYLVFSTLLSVPI